MEVASRSGKQRIQRDAVRFCAGRQSKCQDFFVRGKALKEAVEHGKMGHADVATQAAESAVTHLSQVK